MNPRVCVTHFFMGKKICWTIFDDKDIESKIKNLLITILKTWLVAIFTVVRAILYPSTKICIASSTRPQANEVLSKIIDDFLKNYDWGSINLANEIKEIMNYIIYVY